MFHIIRIQDFRIQEVYVYIFFFHIIIGQRLCIFGFLDFVKKKNKKQINRKKSVGKSEAEENGKIL